MRQAQLARYKSNRLRHISLLPSMSITMESKPRYPPAVPVRRTAGLAKQSQNVGMPLKQLLPHAPDTPVLEQTCYTEVGSGNDYEYEPTELEKRPLSDYDREMAQDYPEAQYENLAGIHRAAELPLEVNINEAELAGEEPSGATQEQPLLGMPVQPKGKRSGKSVYEITKKDADEFKATDKPYYDGGDVPRIVSQRAIEFTRFIKIVAYISCFICMWPFSCICLCCAYRLSLKVTKS